ncbi:MAG: bifunctional protein-serine/threonine kinase/phosphatase [Sulfurovum sp.]|uniref:protein kinase domain-containing protein n=1 Tax=Sulfurovum sp. TaxID=1969726 RepID=UPI003C70F0EB
MSQLQLTIGQYTSKGRKEVNQDFHDIRIPSEPLISSKGIAIAIADGISSSKVSQEASKISVSYFLEDYFSTSEAWSVKKSAHRVIQATNSWIYAQNRQNLYHLDKDRGYVCTFSAMVIKSSTAYIFHIGDIRIYRVREGVLEQLTEDHRTWVSREKSYLARALGIDTIVRIDYETLDVKEGDTFLFMTDGVYEFVNDDWMIKRLLADDSPFDTKAKEIVQKAYEEGSDDNLTMQIVRVDTLPEKNAEDIQLNLPQKQLPPILEARMEFDGYTIIRELSKSSRSHVYLARDNDTGQSAVIKIPSTEHKEDKAYLERFLLEEWIARRINSQHVLKAYPQDRERNYLYTVMEYVEGQTLEQWIVDNPTPSLEEVRSIVDQAAKGLLAFHRQEMIHQDLRPANIMIDKTGSVKIIDLGAVRVAGITEINTFTDEGDILGTMTYSAPEYFLGEVGTYRSDLFSLAVIVYQMLSGKLPYGTHVAKANTKSAQRKLKYRSLYTENSDIPFWIDETLRKASHPNPFKRYSELSEFTYDLRHPNPKYLKKVKPPLLERNPIAFWQIISFIQAMIIILLLISKT